MPYIPKPVLHLKMQGNANDSSGYDNHGTVYGATLTTGRFDKPNSAYSFNGSSDYIDCGNDVSLDLTTSITFDVWIKRNLVDVTTQNILCKGLNSYQLYLDGAGIRFAKTGVSVIATSTSTISDTIQWHHIIVTWNGTTCKIYLDGIDVSGSTNPETLSTTAYVLGIGVRPDTLISYFNGVIAEVRIYPVVLTRTQVKYLYNTTKRNYR